MVAYHTPATSCFLRPLVGFMNLMNSKTLRGYIPFWTPIGGDGTTLRNSSTTIIVMVQSNNQESFCKQSGSQAAKIMMLKYLDPSLSYGFVIYKQVANTPCWWLGTFEQWSVKAIVKQPCHFSSFFLRLAKSRIFFCTKQQHANHAQSHHFFHNFESYKVTETTHSGPMVIFPICITCNSCIINEK